MKREAEHSIECVSEGIYHASGERSLEHRRNPTYLYPKLQAYGDKDVRKCDLSCTSLTWRVIRTRRKYVLEPVAKASYEEVSVVCKVLGMLWATFRKQGECFLLN
jgi:hypothetical protein